METRRRFGLKMMLYGNPIGIIYGCSIGLLRGIIYLLFFIPSVVVAIASAVPEILYGIATVIRIPVLFAAELFVYVHSERRTRRMAYAALGAMIAYTFGYAVIVTSGGILAVIAYKLTPVRWLQLAPAARPK